MTRTASAFAPRTIASRTITTTAATTRTAFKTIASSSSSSFSTSTTTTVSSPTRFANVDTTLRADVDEAAEATSMSAENEDATADVAGEQAVEDLSRVVYVVNLSYETSFGAVKEQFSQFGTVEKLFMPKFKESGKFKGIAFVTMSSEAERDAAIAAMNGSEIDGRTVIVDKARPRGERKTRSSFDRSSPRAEVNSDLTKLYVGNISYDTDAAQLEEYFSKYGEVSNVYVPTDKYSGEPRGFAFLAMKPEDATRAIEESDGVEMNGRSIEVKVSLPKGVKAPNRRNESKLYIGNMSFNTDESELRQIFEEYGPVIDLYVPLDQNTGRPRGFAFVTLECDNAERAIQELDGWELDGRMLRVNEAQPKGGGGGGGGYRGGNRGGSYNYDNEGSDVNAW